jgi:hypothetical protein
VDLLVLRVRLEFREFRVLLDLLEQLVTLDSRVLRDHVVMSEHLEQRVQLAEQVTWELLEALDKLELLV